MCVWGGENACFSLLLKHCDGECRGKKEKKNGLEKLVQMAWSKLCIICSSVGFHLITKNELFWVVVPFVFVFFFSLTSDYFFVIWGLCVVDQNRVLFAFPRRAPGMLCIWQDWSCKRWLSMHLFWLPDKYYIVIVCLFPQERALK